MLEKDMRLHYFRPIFLTVYMELEIMTGIIIELVNKGVCWFVKCMVNKISL